MKRKLPFDYRESKRVNQASDTIEHQLQEILLTVLKVQKSISDVVNSQDGLSLDCLSVSPQSNLELLTLIQSHLTQTENQLRELPTGSDFKRSLQKTLNSLSFIHRMDISDLQKQTIDRWEYLMYQSNKDQDTEMDQSDITTNNTTRGQNQLTSMITFDLKNSFNTLEMRYQDVGACRAREIAASLRMNRNVHKVGLRYNDLGVEGAVAIADAIQGNWSIKAVDLRRRNQYGPFK